MKTTTLFLIFFGLYASGQQTTSQLQDSLIQQFKQHCSKINFNTQMAQRQSCIDNLLKQDSTVAYLWQQKAMPYFKVKKYEVGMQYLDKAVQYDQKRWLPYRAFIKCIFAKTYKDAIQDFQLCIEQWGDNYVMDHTFSFYIGMSYLQLNEFEKAKSHFQTSIKSQEQAFGNAHFLDLFYHGITFLELQQYNKAIQILDKALDQYPNFSDALYYKALCLMHLNQSYEALLQQAQTLANQGYTITEDNAIYEPYPYQVKWK